MESAELDLVDESRDPTNEVPKLAAPEPAKPGRMPSGTLAPPLPTHAADDDLAGLRVQAQAYYAEGAWEDLSRTLRSIIDLGQLMDVLDEQETLDLYAQLGRIEDDRLGRTDEAIHAWREVLAIDPSELRALMALESLFERDGRPTDALEMVEKRALLLEDDDARRATLLQAALAWDELGNRDRAAELFERVRAAEPGHGIASERLAAIYRDQREWATLVEILLERSEAIEEVAQQIELLHEVAQVYERELDDAESAFYVLQAAFNRDHRHDQTARELERLAAATNLWQELLDEHTKRVAELEREDRRAAADLWVKIAGWYRDQLAHREYALHAMQQALRLEPAHAVALAGVASLQRQHGDIGGAIEAYERVLAQDPTSADALGALDRLYRQQQAWEPLAEVLARRAKLAVEDTERVDLQLELGSVLDLHLADGARAIAAYEKVLELEPRNVVALRALEGLYEKTSQHDKYLRILDAQLAFAAGDGERISLYERIAATHEERFGDLASAAAAYEQIIELDPRNYAAYHLLARLYQQAGNHEALADAHRRHIAATTDAATRIELSVVLGQLYTARLRDLDRAIEAYNDALALDPSERRALDALAALYEQLGEWDHAARTLERVIQASDEARKPELYCRVGRIQYKQLGEPAAAEASLLRGLALDPEHVATMQALIEQYADRGDWLKAAQMMLRAEPHVRVAVDKVRLLCDAANIQLHRLNAPDQAKPLYAQAIALDPEHVEAGRALASLRFDAGEWKELSPVIDMLCRKAAQLRLEPRELHELHFRAARCADELGEHAKALGYYKIAGDIDAMHVPTLVGRADLLFKLQDWDAAGKAYQTLLVEHREGQREADLARMYHRLGIVLKALGHKKKALGMFAKALELEPQHRDTLLATIDLQTELADWDAVVRAKRALAETADGSDKLKLLEEIGALYQTRLQSAPKAAAAYVEALELAPDARQLLQKLLDLYIEHKQWKAAVETIERFVALEKDAFRQGLYFHAAGTLCRDELKSLDEAVDYYDCALDSFFTDPAALDETSLSRALMSFQAIDAILTGQRDWKAQERAYRDMLKRLPADNPRFHKLQVSLLDGLGEIYRSRLKQFAEASQVFELAQHMDPDNALRPHATDRAEILAELYLVAGADHADKAIEQHTRMLRKEPFKYDSYKALAHIYRETQQWDSYWCVCNTLAFLKKADGDEHAFFEQYKPRGLVKPKRAMTTDSWSKLAHPDENRYISAILGAIWQGVAAMNAFPHKDFGVKREDRRQLATDQLMFSKLLVHVAKTLDVQTPDVYLLADNKAAEIQLANAIEKSELCPSFVVRPHLLQGKTEREVAFLAARRLTFMRPEYYLRMLLPTNTELKVALLSAIVMVQPRFPVPPNLVATIQAYLPRMQKRMPPHALEQLGALVQRFIQATPESDMAAWGHAVDATSHRAGFVTCGDLGISARAVAVEPVVVGGPTAKQKVKELVLFSISREYFAIRAQMGLTIAG